MWKWVIRPRSRSRRGWPDIIGGCWLSAAGVVIAVLAYDTVLRIGGALLIVSGIRWVVIGAIRRRELAESPGA